MQMNFRHLLEEKFKTSNRFKGVTCGSECGSEWAEKGLVGYELNGAAGGKVRGIVRVGIILDMDIIGVFYAVGKRVYKVLFVSPKFLENLDFVIETMWKNLDEDLDVGSEKWVSRRFEEAVPAIVTEFAQIKNEHTSNKAIVFHNTLVDFGFNSAFAVLVFAWVDGSFVAAIAEKKAQLIKPSYELVLSDAGEMNGLYLQVKNSKFTSKKGNAIYEVSEELFSRFHRVQGNWICLECSG